MKLGIYYDPEDLIIILITKHDFLDDWVICYTPACELPMSPIVQDYIKEKFEYIGEFE